MCSFTLALHAKNAFQISKAPFPFVRDGTRSKPSFRTDLRTNLNTFHWKVVSTSETLGFPFHLYFTAHC
ncbi:hypothetical protein M5D96_013433 [Drosophila gunungcola]|uniref:Uncharacterized protein n=1 Tax=Drosophila gunungcola TaxID=103775 RepID=A0A9Q0BII8_9MUSC|nr:hypothetical protein M5D96_013433 [Drosophila gunungcola]